MFEGCPCMTSFVAPAGITDVSSSKVSDDFLRNSSIYRITFLGIQNGDTIRERVCATKFFGRNSTVYAVMGNGSLWIYDTANFYKLYDSFKTWHLRTFNGQLTTVEQAKKYLSLSTPYVYDSAIADFCLNNSVPLMIVYVDSMTSVRSQDFVVVMSDANTMSLFAAKEIKGVILVLDRQETQKVSHFKGILTRLNQSIQAFPFVLYTYNGKTISEQISWH